MLLDDSHASTEIVGCYTSKFKWCSSTHQVPLWLYVGATGTILGVSFPITFVPINTLFSKVLGERRQVGTLSGLILNFLVLLKKHPKFRAQ